MVDLAFKMLLYDKLRFGITVVGVAFAIAPDRPGTAYALTAKEIRAILPPSALARPVPTGACLTEG